MPDQSMTNQGQPEEIPLNREADRQRARADVEQQRAELSDAARRAESAPETGGQTLRSPEGDTSTERATRAAVAPTFKDAPEYPTLGEQDGRFYLRKTMDGHGDIPDQTHADNIEEVKVVARNSGFEVIEDPSQPHGTAATVDKAERTEDGWVAFYSVPVKPKPGDRAERDPREWNEDRPRTRDQ